MENSNYKDEYLTVKEFSKLLKVNKYTVYKLISEKREPGKIFAKRLGGSWRIPRKEIDRFFANGKENKL